MTAKAAVLVAGLLQIVLRTSLFIEQSRDQCSPAPTISSWIFLIALLDLLSDLCIYPERYMHLPYGCQVLAKTIIAIIFTEFGSIIVWCNIERFFAYITKAFLLVLGMHPHTYLKYGRLILGVVLTTISSTILVFVGQATDHFYLIRKRYHCIERKVALNIDMLWDYIHGIDDSRKRDRYVDDYNYEDILCPKKKRYRRDVKYN